MSDREPGAGVFVAGHNGLVGSAICRALEQRGVSPIMATRDNLDLKDRDAVDQFFKRVAPKQVYVAAARVGGILANDTYPANFIFDNLVIQNNVIDSAYRHGVEKLLFLGSSCIYPREAAQPLTEDCLLSGPLEPTNEWYAVAKIAGIKLCQAYRRQYGFDAISVMPTNLFGPRDNFDLKSSHVLPALIRKCHEAKVRGNASVEIWGTGSPRREFLFVDDLADACVWLMDRYSDEQIINVGVGEDISIRELATLVTEIVGFNGTLDFDTSKPDGTPRKLLDVSRLDALGWRARTTLRDGIDQTYQWFLKNVPQ